MAVSRYHASSSLPEEEEEESGCESESDELESVAVLLSCAPVSVPSFPSAPSLVCGSVLSDILAGFFSLKNASMGRSKPSKDQKIHKRIVTLTLHETVKLTVNGTTVKPV